MSTPRLLLGRSLTCPSAASTVKPGPRYFWMVFALAGDSTMTKPFDKIFDNIVSLVPLRTTQQRGSCKRGESRYSVQQQARPWLLALGSSLKARAASERVEGALSERLDVILARQLTDFPRQLQLKQRRKNLRRRELRLECLHDLVNVG